LAFTMIPYVFRDSITRVYYSFNDSTTPFLTALSSIVLKFFLNWLLVAKLAIGSGIGGITLSTSLVTLFNACVLGFLIRKKIRLDYKSLFKNFGKMLLAGLITLVVTYSLGLWFNHAFSYLPAKIFDMTKIISIGLACLICYVYLNLLFKMEYALELTERLIGKLKQKLKIG